LTTSNGFRFKWPIKLQKLITGFEHPQVETFKISMRVNDEFQNLTSRPMTVSKFWLAAANTCRGQ